MSRRSTPTDLGLEALDLEVGLGKTSASDTTIILSPHVSFSKLLQSVTDFNSGAYKAGAIALGPYNSNIKCKYDSFKKNAVQRTLLRLQIKDEVTLYKYATPHLEGKIIGFYHGTNAAAIKDDLVPLVIRDSCFLLEFLRSKCPDVVVSNGGHNILMGGDFVFDGKDNIVKLEIMKDILKLENQLPLCVLVWILQLEFLGNPKEKSVDFLAQVLYNFPEFCGFPLENFRICFEEFEKLVERCAHLLDLNRLVLKSLLKLQNPARPTRVPYCSKLRNLINRFKIASPRNGYTNSRESERESYYQKPRSLPSAVKLEVAGIVFKCSDDHERQGRGRGQGRGRAVSFRNRTLFVPPMVINDMAEIVLRNVMALEELLACKRNDTAVIGSNHGSSDEEKTVCEFMRFMDEIIDTEEDVALLRKRKILRRSMGGSDEEVASIFNGFGKCVTSMGDLVDDIREDILRHYDNMLMRLIMEFKYLYFSKPWHLIALFAAILQLGLSAVQTYYNVVN